MKKSSILLGLILCVGITGFGQDYEMVEPFNDNEHRCASNQRGGGFFIGIGTNYSQFANEDAVVFEAKAGYVHNGRLDVGLAGKGFFSEIDKQKITDQTITLTGAYGGLYVSPHIKVGRNLKLGFPVLMGVGSVGYINKTVEDILDHGSDDVVDWDVLLVMEPGLDLIFEVSRSFHIEIGSSYRFTNDVELDGINRVDLDGFSGGIGLKFGIL